MTYVNSRPGYPVGESLSLIDRMEAAAVGDPADCQFVYHGYKGHYRCPHRRSWHNGKNRRHPYAPPQAE